MNKYIIYIDDDYETFVFDIDDPIHININLKTNGLWWYIEDGYDDSLANEIYKGRKQCLFRLSQLDDNTKDYIKIAFPDRIVPFKEQITDKELDLLKNLVKAEFL